MKTANPHHKDQALIFQQTDFSIIKLANTKQDRVFKEFLNGWKGNRFDAERQLHDHVLPQTVFDIKEKYSAPFQSEWEVIIAFEGYPTRVKKYWIAPEDCAFYLRRIS